MTKDREIKRLKAKVRELLTTKHSLTERLTRQEQELMGWRKRARKQQQLERAAA